MAPYNGFQDFVLRLGEGVHQLHAAGHELKVYLTDNLPDAAADTIKTDLVGITEEWDYAAIDVENDYTEAVGTGSLICQDKVWTANGGDLESARYVVLYNETPAAPLDPLIAWWDYGASVVVKDGETFTVNFGAAVFTIAVV